MIHTEKQGIKLLMTKQLYTKNPLCFKALEFLRIPIIRWYLEDKVSLNEPKIIFNIIITNISKIR
jgi:hypothetical protein